MLESAREVNKLKAKIRARARIQVKGTPLEKDLIRLGFLAPEKVGGKNPPASGKRADMNQRSASARRANGTRLKEVLASWGFQLKEDEVDKGSHSSPNAKKKSTTASRKKQSRRRDRKTETHP